ncbi:uncharacterized protein ARB_07841 [Trichophyton benhamiae CBS 112371]|uniref:Oxidoreductase swnN n=1 Tax=Arthroderma benhamiae (strain ATCC MYA-4681 / CBS 112371) TaxID=663331 RepID=SWNN_ARTBC|nr:uncharacterized protein ARB_07841 [Trichophyton benhamiae CBS 112371]D4AU28.1 RecName: Full=Oxidoreductase swnN; AltName: Full=Swainsonine biosynthesis gene cluster protein N [Trichophyton benhamiae CBS 112371]EFE33481.1 conserved hypothetical protein [Trichophyton benhamiae CBS 112371]
MAVVAVAGGTGGKGVPGAANEPRRYAVDYDNVEEMRNVLKENNVEVVVSALLLSDESVAKSQINLIRAAAESGTVTKFIPSEYYIDFHSPIPGSDLFTNFQIEAEEELMRHPQLTWTLIRVGIFLDHLTMPFNPKPTYITPYWVFVDIEHEECVFPGDGSQPLVLSHSTDLAAYIECLVGLPSNEWPRESLVASNKIQVKDLQDLIKKTTGTLCGHLGICIRTFLILAIGREFKVTYDSVESIQKGQITPLTSNRPVFDDPQKGKLFQEVEVQVMLSMLSNAHDLPGKNLAELFPEVHVTNIEDFLRAGWEMKQGLKP